MRRAWVPAGVFHRSSVSRVCRSWCEAPASFAVRALVHVALRCRWCRPLVRYSFLCWKVSRNRAFVIKWRLIREDISDSNIFVKALQLVHAWGEKLKYMTSQRTPCECNWRTRSTWWFEATGSWQVVRALFSRLGIYVKLTKLVSKMTTS